MKMNKLKMIDAISKESGLSKSDALKAMDAFLSISIRTLKKGEKIMLKDFGTFHVVKRAARTARNINTNKEIKVPAKKVVRFVVGKELGGRLKWLVIFNFQSIYIIAFVLKSQSDVKIL